MATDIDVVGDAIASGVAHLTGGSRLKLSRPAVRVVSALLGKIVAEWDRYDASFAYRPCDPSPRDMAQRVYARNASSALRQAISRMASAVRIDDVMAGYDTATESLAHTDTDDAAASGVVVKAKR
jgi:hypothetical protein